MNHRDISTAHNADLRASQDAMRRAAEQARQAAIQTGTDLIIVQDGKTVRIPATVLREKTQATTVPTT